MGKNPDGAGGFPDNLIIDGPHGTLGLDILSIHLNKRGTVKISVTGYLMFPKFHES